MATPESGAIAVLAEKPSVARDIARVLGATGRGDGYMHGGGYVITWAIGHLAALAQPHEIHPEWRQWRRDLLPMLPDQWPLVIYDKTKAQFDVVRKIRNSPRISRIVCADGQSSTIKGTSSRIRVTAGGSAARTSSSCSSKRRRSRGER